MAEMFEARLPSSPAPLSMTARPAYRIHRVTCPACGRAVWVLLRADCTPEEVDRIRRQQARRLLTEPCELHRDL